MTYASYSKLPKKLKNGIEILVGQVFKLLIKTVKLLFGLITQEPLGLPNFQAIFEFLGQLTAGCIHYPKIKLLIILRSQIFIHMPILPNNHICPKFPLWHWAKSKGVLECEVRWKVGPKGFCFCFVFDGYVRCKALKRGSKEILFSSFFLFFLFFSFFFFCGSKVCSSTVCPRKKLSKFWRHVA